MNTTKFQVNCLQADELFPCDEEGWAESTDTPTDRALSNAVLALKKMGAMAQEDVTLVWEILHPRDIDNPSCPPAYIFQTEDPQLRLKLLARCVAGAYSVEFWLEDYA